MFIGAGGDPTADPGQRIGRCDGRTGQEIIAPMVWYMVATNDETIP